MKKIFCILSICAVITACGGGSNDNNSSAGGNENQDTVAETDQVAKSRNSEADTTANNIGTNRTEGDAKVENKSDTQKGEQLIAQSDCLTCHKVDQKLVGPAYADVAKKYEANDKNIEYLADKVIKGGAGVWGQVPMTPHPAVSKDDAKEMVKYVLSLRNK